LFPLHEHACTSAHAQLAEAAGDHAQAATLYAEAAAHWQQFGNVPEHAHALLGQGRCLLAPADPAAEQPLRQAAELFSSMGYRPSHPHTRPLTPAPPPARPPPPLCADPPTPTHSAPPTDVPQTRRVPHDKPGWANRSP